MAYKRFEQYLFDLIHEQQLKIGYRSEAVRLYFPLESLQHLLGVKEQGSLEGGNPYAAVESALEDFAAGTGLPFGRIGISHKGKRFCLTMPKEAADYVHDQAKEDAFLAAFLAEITAPGCSLKSLVDLFERFSSRVKVTEMEEDEFDYLIYFEDGLPNDYRYCISFEEGHASYHRFIPEDYEGFGFKERKV